MKKFLSMVMALAMTLTLVTVGASAKDFTDNSKITYGEAVDVISSLKVVDGYTDGSFNPTATLTRGAAAKIICNMILGPTTASALGVTSAPFTDVPVTNVFAGYIAYCSSKGIINGYGDGTFKPAATVTGYQFMKMLLGALGYDGTIEGFTGTNWTVNVAKLAVSIGLDDGNDSFVGSKAMTREEAALYAFNTLTADMVKYQSKGTTITVNGATIVTGATEAGKVDATVATTDPVTYEGYKASGNDAYVQFCEQYFPKLELTSSGVAGDFGRPTNTWYNDSTKIGAYDSKTPVLTLTSTTKEKDIYTALGADGLTAGQTAKYVVMDQIYVDGVLVGKSTGDNTSGFSADSGFTGYDAAYAGSVLISKGLNSDTVGTGNGTTVEIYKTDTANHYIMVVINQYLAKISSVTKADANTDTGRLINLSVTGAANGSFETDNFAKGDYVLVTESNSVIKSAVAATVLENVAVTAYSTSAMTANGTSYKYSANYAGGSKYVTTPSVSGGYTMSGTATYTLYLDANGYVIKDETYTADNGDYLLVLDTVADKTADEFDGTYYTNVKYVNGDGTVSTVKVMQTASGTPAASSNTWYTMEEDSDNAGYYKLTPVAEYNSANSTVAGYVTAAALSNDKLSNTQALIASGVVANSNTVFVLKTGATTYKTYTGISNVPGYAKDSLETTPNAYSVVKDGYAVLVYIDVTGISTASSSADELIYLFSTSAARTEYDTTNKVYYKVYTAIVDGEKTEVKLASDATVSTAGLEKVTAYNSNGYISTVSAVASTSGYATVSVTGKTVSYSAPTLTIDGTPYVLSSNVDVYMVDSDDTLTVASPEDLEGAATGAFYVVYNSTTDSTVTAIYFDGSIA